MGLRRFLARTTSSPSGYAQAYVSDLLELIDFLTASFIVYSGRKAVTGPTRSSAAVFENHFQMEQAGFECTSFDIGLEVAPTIQAVAADVELDLLSQTFRSVTAFLFVYSDNAARKHFSPDHATQFTATLFRLISERTAGMFGFSADPSQVREAISGLAPLFPCNRILNADSFGEGDGLGLLLSSLTPSPDGLTQRGFVVGSRKQPLGCASGLVTAIEQIDTALRTCASDLRW